jgi:hypothetical protein
MSATSGKVTRLTEIVEECELALGIDSRDRWSSRSKEYLDTLEYMRKRKYILSLDHLQKLVIQRLFELQKCNLESTGKLDSWRLGIPLTRFCY